MKTSTKLIIALFATVPLCIVAYGYLLKQQFKAGNFAQNIYHSSPNYTFKALPPFEHVVVDGNLFTTNENPLTKKSNKSDNVHRHLSSGIQRWNLLRQKKRLDITF